MRKLICILLATFFTFSSVSINCFASNVPFTRGSFCVKMVELLEIEYDVSDVSNPFFDVSVEDDYYRDVLIMYMLGYMNDNDGYFNPLSKITNGQVASILVNMIFSDFTVPDDVELGKAWYAEYAWKAKESGLMPNVTDWEIDGCESDINAEKIKEYAPLNIVNRVENGTCGESLTWELTSDGVLTIKGTGAMSNYSLSNNAPWYEKRVLSVNVENGVTSIGDYAFLYSDISTISLSDTIENIGNSAFFGCSKLNEILIPKSVMSIGDSAFDWCVSLENIFVHADNSMYYDIDGVLVEKIWNELIRFPEGKKEKIYVIPEGVKGIGRYSFSQCNQLEELSLSQGVSYIGYRAFESCENLGRIDLVDTLTNISSGAFTQCESLINIEIPKSVTNIGDSLFYNCKKLEEIKVHEDNQNYCDIDGILFSKDKKTIIKFPAAKEENEYTIPDGVKKIYDYAFMNCEKLRNVSFPESLRIIGKSAFSMCYRLTEVIVPGNVVDIQSEAFGGCHDLAVVTICEGTTTIGKSAFDDCDYLSKVYIPKSVVSIGENAFRNNSFTYEHNFVIYGYSDSYAKDYALSNNLRFVEIAEKVMVDVKEESENIICDVTLSSDVLVEDSKIFIATYKESGRMEQCKSSNVEMSGSTNVSIKISNETTIVKIFVWENDTIRPLCDVTYMYL